MLTPQSSIRGGGPGEKAGRIRRRLLPDTEVIGPPECPLLHRWTLLKVRGRKVMLHRFLPNADDRAEHDHPSSFVTFVLRGHYDDESPAGLERMRAGMVRFRPAEHRHRTRVGPKGCWTLVIMGAKRRPWGFWTDGRWFDWRDHELIFGYGMRCADEEVTAPPPPDTSYVSWATRNAVRRAAADLRAALARRDAITRADGTDGGGHPGIEAANLEGYLGRFAEPLLDAYEAAESENGGLRETLEEAVRFITEIDGRANDFGRLKFVARAQDQFGIGRD